MNVVIESISEKIKRLREERGFSKYRLAKLSGIRESYIGQLEAGIVEHPRSDTLAALARGLNIDPSVFFGGDERRPMPDLIKEIQERYQALELTEIPIKGTIPGHYPFTIEKRNNSATILKEWVNDVDDLSTLYALEINNDELREDGIYPGFTLIVDGADKAVSEGKLYIVRIGDEIYARHSNELPVGDFEILGRVILAGRWKKL